MLLAESPGKEHGTEEEHHNGDHDGDAGNGSTLVVVSSHYQGSYSPAPVRFMKSAARRRVSSTIAARTPGSRTNTRNPACHTGSPSEISWPSHANSCHSSGSVIPPEMNDAAHATTSVQVRSRASRNSCARHITCPRVRSTSAGSAVEGTERNAEITACVDSAVRAQPAQIARCSRSHRVSLELRSSSHPL